MSGPSEQPVPRQRSEHAPRETPTVESPRPEVEHPADSARMPGVPRTQYTKMPTGPVSTEPLVATGPADPAVQWAPQDDVIVDDKGRLAPWALVAAIVSLVASWFVGWGIPLAIIAVTAAMMSLRRPVESRSIAIWALVLGLAATMFSLGWLIWAAMQFEQIG